MCGCHGKHHSTCAGRWFTQPIVTLPPTPSRPRPDLLAENQRLRLRVAELESEVERLNDAVWSRRGGAA